MEFQRETLIIRSMRFSPVLVKVFKLKLDFAYLKEILREKSIYRGPAVILTGISDC